MDPPPLHPRFVQPTMDSQSNPLLSSPTFHPNESSYTLATVRHDPESDESSSLLSSSSSTPTAYGTTPIHPPHRTRRVIFNATFKMALIFAVSCIFLGGTLWAALPTLDPYVKPPFYSPSGYFTYLRLSQSERIAHYSTYRSLFPTFRISTIS